MRIIEDLSDFPADIRTVVTSGTFDGVHVGHAKILRKVSRLASENELSSAVITYWPHPRFVLHQNDDTLKLITTFEEKADLIRQTGIDYLVRIPFTQEFSQMPREQFVQRVLIQHLNTRFMVIGYDHHFGKDRLGNFQYLSENSDSFGFEVREISRQDIDDVGVSSTKIREYIMVGKVEEASALLGRSYSIKGLVVHGEKKGRSIGFPTANIWVPEGYKLIPGDGAYATRIKHEEALFVGMTNIGVRPTVDGEKRKIEVNIFDLDERLYGRELEIFFIEKLRDEKKFGSLNELSEQLKQDKTKTLEILGS